MNGQKKTGQKIKYHGLPMRFDIALQKYIPDFQAIEKIKKELKKKR